MKVQPIDIGSRAEKETAPARAEPVKPALKSLLKRIFDRPFPSVLRTSAADKLSIGETQFSNKDGATEFEPSSICLDKMVQNFIEDSHYDKQPPPPQPPAKYGRNRCNCFNGNSNDSSDDEFDAFGELINGGSPPADACETLKSLAQCATVVERNLLADTAMIVEKNRNCKRKDDLRKIVMDDLISLGYNSSICKSKWDKSPSFPAGEYEYIDVVFVEEGRMLIDVDFRSEFEMARSTGTYKAVVQSLPFIFVGKPDRLDRIVSIVSEAAKQSLKNKGMHLPPWRKTEYMRAKWLSQFTRASSQPDDVSDRTDVKETFDSGDCGELDLIFGEDKTASSEENSGENELPVTTWQLPPVKAKSVEGRTEIVTGLASLFKEKP
ncbi:ADP-ribosylation factor-like protein 5-like isoform 1 [Hibiscus syriacus]|uniref:ADP-ribosylation factor-like protein 5-like isoform 1 n=1 Tax=Hibiscus syriacus TaxID=106335 RepID=A0A6A2YC22_HIBSY|nr:uncharacterized protein LOC120175160 [Hibiscus syriacus]KAE8670387.1 ADP-ribosylation factor-like protein 5-like isoform 1 [Hibiscus syriacus]